MKSRMRPCVLFLICLTVISVTNRCHAADPQESFQIVVYIPVEVVLKMRDRDWLANSWAQISSQVHVDKVYIETYRSRVLADDELIEQVKHFFVEKGVAVAGGICYSDNDNGQFASFTYTKTADREYVKHISQMTAKHFDEVILDDFFFANTKAPSDIASKGKATWTEFRLKTMDEASRDLVVGPAKAVNPKVRMIIKFPNWYEHFAANGYDLQQEPKIFDGIYAGTETRDPVQTDQNLQQYEGFNIVRYFENIDPDRMGGGWVDTYDIQYIDRYAEQLWLTVFAKAKEMTLFNYINLLQEATPGERPWTSEPTSLRWNDILTRAKGKPIFASVAGESLDLTKPFIDKLGTPAGIASYRPYQATGEDFLHNFLGMIGIPINLCPAFPKDADVILLTEAAKADPAIVSEMKTSLTAGKTVIITSGLLHALQGNGIEDLVELRYSSLPAPVTDFLGAFGPGAGSDLGRAEKPILFPQVRFFTNDAWPVIRGVADQNAFPILLMDKYAAGTLFVLVVPDNFADLYRLPEPTLNALRSYITAKFSLQLEAPARVSLLAYDNGSFIIESFRDEPTEIGLLTTPEYRHLQNLQTGESIMGEAWIRGSSHQATRPAIRGGRTEFHMTLQPHSFLVFQQAR